MNFFAGAILCLSLTVFCQVKGQSVNPPLSGNGNSIPPPITSSDSTDEFTLKAEELRYAAEIRRAEKSHKEMSERAKEVSKLSSELLNELALTNSFSDVSYDKLKKIEKLVKKIRDEAGGSGDIKKAQITFQTLNDSLTKLHEISKSLHKRIDRTSRHVTSVAVVEEANEILHLIQSIRIPSPR